MSEGGQDAPGGVVMPPLLYVGTLGLGLGLEHLVPLALLSDVVQYAIGFALIAASFLIAVPTLIQFRRAGTQFDVRKPATVLVTTGPFRYSRNPGYLALNLLFAGIGIAADSPWSLALLIPVLLVMHFGVIRREERYLERKFGADYRRYKGKVRRWI